MDKIIHRKRGLNFRCGDGGPVSVPGGKAAVGAVCGGGQWAAAAAGLSQGRPTCRVTGRRLRIHETQVSGFNVRTFRKPQL